MFTTRVQIRAPMMASRARRTTTVVRADVLTGVRTVISEQLGKDLEEVTPEATFVDDLGADSLDTVEIMMALEEKFDIELDESGAEDITKVEDAVKLIEKVIASK